MIKVYCYSLCSTCKKALAWLDAHGYKYDLIDIKTQHPDEKTLRSLHKKSGLPLKKFFNTSGLLYKSMELKNKLPEMSEEEQLRLLATDGMLVKRPILINGTKVVVGFKESDYEEAVK